MAMDYEKWHDGIGHDLEAIDEANAAERGEIERLLLSGGVNDWRDVEALARLDSAAARRALREAFTSGRGGFGLPIHVIRYAPSLVSEAERTEALVAALRGAEFGDGLSEALDESEDSHPPAVIEALREGARQRAGDVACHFAAMLMYLHGQAAEPFDWNLRPYFLRFNTEDRAEREQVYGELCARLGIG
jgi:hypothetical protein